MMKVAKSSENGEKSKDKKKSGVVIETWEKRKHFPFTVQRRQCKFRK
jgi:hypothetical protein